MKFAKMLFVLLLSCVPSYAVFTGETIIPINQARTLNAFTIYIVGGSTTTSATYRVYGSTELMTTTVAGKYPGSHRWNLASFTYDTLISSLNAMGLTVAGCEGGIVAARVQGAYGPNPATYLGPTGAIPCLGSTLVKTSTGMDTNGITYTLPAVNLGPEQQYHITGANVNCTFASGSTSVLVYDGATTADTLINKEAVATTAVDSILDISPMGDFQGSENTAMRFDVGCSTNITAGWINIQGHMK